MISLSLRSVYRRITVNKLSLAFFLFSFIHCFAQGITQSFLYSLDSDSSTLVSTILRDARVPRRELAWLTGYADNFQLHLCTNVPFGRLIGSCTTLFESSNSNASVPVPAGLRRMAEGKLLNEPFSRRSIDSDKMTLKPSYNSSGQIDGVNLSVNGDANTTFLNNQCTRLLVYPDQVFKDFVREDAALIAIQFWLFAISFFAILYESIPHLLSVLVARALVTNFSAFSTWRTGHIANYIQRIVMDDNSPCRIDLFATYFRTKAAFEITNLVLHSVGLLLSVFFSWRLLKVYNKHTFKTIGPPKEIVRIYRIFMAFFVCLQLSVFCLITAMALWINELINGAISLISTHTTAYLGVFIGSTILLIPWISMGWFAVRREMKKLMAGFLFLGFLYIAAWSIMFYSLVYRWTVFQWPFFAALTAEAFIVMIASCILGVICWRNFDKGLAPFLHAENALRKDGFQPEMFTHDEEKNSFDSDFPQKQTLHDLKEIKL